MKYGLITVAKARENGIPTYGRRRVGFKIIISEWDIMRTDKMTGDLEERCETLACSLITENDMKNKLKR